MAAKKTAPASRKKTAATKGSPKAAKTAKTAKKKAATKKPAAKASGKKAAARKAAPKKAAPKPSPDVAAAPAEEAAAKAPASTAASPGAAKSKGPISSKQVNLGHVLALRPRVSASFKADSLREARQQLEDEGYPTIEDAARAVAEKALELTRDGGKGRSRGRR